MQQPVRDRSNGSLGVFSGVVFYLLSVLLQAYGADAGAERAEEPMEEAGVTEEIIQKVNELIHAISVSCHASVLSNGLLSLLQLQDKATLLTAERKKRGKTTPEGLATSDDIRALRQTASHVVRPTTSHFDVLPLPFLTFLCCRDSTVPACPVFWLWMFV